MLHLSVTGMRMLVGFPKLISILAEEVDGKEGKTSPDLVRARTEAKFAQLEIEKDLPFLHSQAAVALWASLEAAVDTVLASWLANEPGAVQVDAVSKLRVRVGEYEGLNPDERCLYLVELLKHDLGSPFRQGVSRFEAILEPFGLSGRVTRTVSKNLFELQQVRHVLVHRAGVVDNRLSQACPCLKLDVGDPILVRYEEYAKYTGAALQYLIELLKRIHRRYGVRLPSRKGLPPEGHAGRYHFHIDAPATAAKNTRKGS